jgi:hypothetical protein
MTAVASLGHWALMTFSVGSKWNEFISGGLVNVIGEDVNVAFAI